MELRGKIVTTQRLADNAQVADKEGYANNLVGIEIAIFPASAEQQALSGQAGDLFFGQCSTERDIKVRDRVVDGTDKYEVVKVVKVDMAFSNMQFIKIDLLKIT